MAWLCSGGFKGHFNKEMGKIFGAILATKISWYLTNHHTTSSGPWSSYSAKYLRATWSIQDQLPDELQSSMWTVGHFVSTRRAIRWLFKQIGSYDGLNSMFAGDPWIEAVAKSFKVGHDIVFRMRQAPAGAPLAHPPRWAQK